jgi:hypothetical protein
MIKMYPYRYPAIKEMLNSIRNGRSVNICNVELMLATQAGKLERLSACFA